MSPSALSLALGPPDQLAMGRQVYFGLPALVTPLVHLGSASATIRLSSQFRTSAAGPQKPSNPRHYEARIVNNPETGTMFLSAQHSPQRIGLRSRPG